MKTETPQSEGNEILGNLMHAVGYPKFHRNHFCADVGGIEHGRWLMCTGIGLAKAGAFINDGRDQYFSVTEAGIEFLRAVQ